MEPHEEPGAQAGRLCLVMQVDALLMALGAAAADREDHSDPAADAADRLPWRRWLVEDLDLTLTLAVRTLAGGVPLPGILGRPAEHGECRLVSDLITHYTSMRGLLRDALRPADGSPGVEDPALHEVLDRCERRVAELEALSRPAPQEAELYAPW